MKLAGIIFLTLMAMIGIIMACSGSEDGMKETPIYINILGLVLFGISCGLGIIVKKIKGD